MMFGIKKVFFFFFLNSILIHAQNLQYESNGRIVDDMKNKLSVNQVKALLSDNKELLKNYTDARTKKMLVMFCFMEV